MKQRIITAIIAAAIFIPFVYIGELPFTLLIYVIASVALYELLKMKDISLFSFSGLFSLFLLWVLLVPNEYLKGNIDIKVSKVELAMLALLIILTYTVITKNKFTFDQVGFLLLSTIYIGMGFHYFIEIRSEGLVNILYALFIVWATDSGAYFVGRALGKRKLWPEISPNKTVEGFIGGIVCAVIVGVIFSFVPNFHMHFVLLIIGTAVLSVCGQIGDLVESALKRHYAVKDSGTILPGHGGMLDRFDSLLFVLPVLYFLVFL